MPNEQQERHKRFDESFVREDGLLDIDKYSHDELLSFLEDEVALAVANREKEILEMIKEFKTNEQKMAILGKFEVMPYEIANTLIEAIINLISKNK